MKNNNEERMHTCHGIQAFTYWNKLHFKKDIYVYIYTYVEFHLIQNLNPTGIKISNQFVCCYLINPIKSGKKKKKKQTNKQKRSYEEKEKGKHFFMEKWKLFFYNKKKKVFFPEEQTSIIYRIDNFFFFFFLF